MQCVKEGPYYVNPVLREHCGALKAVCRAVNAALCVKEGPCVKPVLREHWGALLLRSTTSCAVKGKAARQ